MLITTIFLSFSCSINQMVMKGLADTLSEESASSIFTDDNDPELIKDAIPLALKIYEYLLKQNPTHQELQLATASACIMYANVFLQTPGGMLAPTAYQEQDELYTRAKNLYLRGRDYLLNSLDQKYAGFKAALGSEAYKDYLHRFTVADVPYLFWFSVSWFGAFSVNNFDFELSIGIPKALALMEQALKLDESYREGVIHEFMIVCYATLPEDMGGSLEKAKMHFRRALELSQNRMLSPYVSYATAICIKTQDIEQFKAMLNTALAIDVNRYPSTRLLNTVNRKKAQWLLEHSNDFFLNEEATIEN